MSTTHQNPSDTSVTFSLAELAKLEQERVREEDARRASDREKTARATREAETARRAAEAAKIAADEEARARRLKAEAEEQARLAAKQRAEIEIARIQAESKVRLDAENAQRAHELALFRVRTEAGRRRITGALAAALALVVAAAGLGGYRLNSQLGSVEQEAERLRDGQQALAKEREHAKATELNALERRFAALGTRPNLRQAEEARAAAETARKAIDTRALDHDRLRAFADALDALEGRLDGLDRLDALDQRRADLAAWAAERKRSDVLAATGTAAARARALCDESALRGYEAALDRAREALAKEPPTGGGRQAIAKTDGGSGGRTCPGPGFPGCGLDGKPIF
jgi:hypothetical protein